LVPSGSSVSRILSTWGNCRRFLSVVKKGGWAGVKECGNSESGHKKLPQGLKTDLSASNWAQGSRKNLERRKDDSYWPACGTLMCGDA